jgi:hypothetical protein
MTLDSLVLQLAGLVGWAALIALLVNVGKTFGWVKDDDGGLWATGGNIVGLIVLFALKIWKPGLDVGQADSVLAQIAQALGILFKLLLPLLLQMGVSLGTHKLAKALRIPFAGKSYSW